MTLLSFWSKSPVQYGLSAGLVLLYCGAVWIVLHPNVSPQYQAYYIDKTSHCFHNKPASQLNFMGKIRFGNNRPAQNYTTLLQGWSWQEPWGTWSDGPLSENDFVLNSDAHRVTNLRFHLMSFAPLGAQTVHVYLNNQLIDEWSLVHERQVAIELDVPIKQPAEKMRLSFHFETPLALKWFGKSSNPKDQRLLAMGLLGFEWIAPSSNISPKGGTP